MKDPNNDVVQENPSADCIPTGEQSADFNLNTYTSPESLGPQDFLPFFAGQNLRRPGAVGRL